MLFFAGAYRYNYYYHGDHLGSSNYITDAKGRVFEHVLYLPYGETWIDEGHEESLLGYKFTGKELDEETNLYYFGHRYFDPKISSWISTDPALDRFLPTGKEEYFPEETFNVNSLKGAGGVFNSLNLSLYNYVHQNPLTLVDPDGEAPTDNNHGKGSLFTLDAGAGGGPGGNYRSSGGGGGGRYSGGEGGGRSGSASRPTSQVNVKPDVAKTSAAARREAMRQENIPTSRPLKSVKSQSGKNGQNQKQYVGESTEGRPKVVTQHLSDKDHPNAHWHAADPKVNPDTRKPIVNDHGQYKYKKDGSTVEYKEK